jgi:hypothetical protein
VSDFVQRYFLNDNPYIDPGPLPLILQVMPIAYGHVPSEAQARSWVSQAAREQRARPCEKKEDLGPVCFFPTSGAAKRTPAQRAGVAKILLNDHDA